jgi:ring-1,2-phenylacetyl-CoA epoxidase subunit PaaA
MVQREIPVASVQADSEMTARYRKTLVRLLADQARAELFAAHMYSRWVRKAPGPEEKLRVAHLAQEETEHWYRTVKLLEELGVPADQVAARAGNDWFIPVMTVLVGRLRWLDILMMSFLIDQGAYFLVEDFAQSSYAPWCKVAQEILEEEVGHPAFGVHFLEDQIRKLGPARVQRALDKWWRVGLNMFGPPDTRRTPLYIRLGLKYRTNEDRRQAFRAATEPAIEKLGLRIPRLWRDRYPFV